jgi:type I restriction enzyme S subunit
LRQDLTIAVVEQDFALGSFLTGQQRKVSDFIKFTGGATPSKSNPDYWGGDIVWLSSQEVKGGYVSNGTYTITQKAVDNHTTKMVSAYTPLIITRSGILANMFPITLPTRDVAINQDIKALIFDTEKYLTAFIGLCPKSSVN